MNRTTLFAGLLGLALAGFASSSSSAADAASPAVASSAPAQSLPRLKISANGRFFVQDNGKPFFYLADTAWGLFPHATPDDVNVDLHDRADKGFTVIQAVAVLWDARSRRNYDGQLPFVDNNPTKPNETYFQNMDHVIDQAQALGMIYA